MRTSLAPDDIARYREDGYLVIAEFLEPAEREELTACTEEAVQRLGRSRVVGNPELDELDGFRHRVVLQRLNLWKMDAVVRRTLLAPALGNMLCDLEGIDGVRIWHDQTFFKPPWAAPTAYHHDLPNWSFSDPHGVQIWIALDDAMRDNGCLYYLPGSHRQTHADRTASISGEVGALFDVYPELRQARSVPVEMPAGGAVVHNGLTVHGAGANMTGNWRRAMTCQYMPDGATFNGRSSILSSEQLAKLSVGDPLNDDADNPLVFRR